MEVLVVGAIPEVNSFECVGSGMGMHQINQHFDVFAVGVVNQLLELAGSAEPAGDCKEVGDVISERPVVGMLEYAHKLDNVVPEAVDTVHHSLPERPKAVHFGFDTAHPHVTLVYLQPLVGPDGIGMLKLVTILDVDSIVAQIGVLVSEVNPGRDTVLIASVCQHHMCLHPGILRDLFALQSELPQSEIVLSGITNYLLGKVLHPIPPVELPEEVDALGAGRPLPIDKAVALPMNPISLVCLGKVMEPTGCLIELLDGRIVAIPQFMEVALS